MVVNSINFLLFFIVVFLVYYMPVVSQRKNLQNIWILITSYFFYGFVDWKMLPLLFCVTVVFYLLGAWLKASMNSNKSRLASRITTLGVVLGVGLLLYFKYLNFFADSFASLLQAVGISASWSTLNIVLPIGVSFFTFKLISYVIEIHRERIQPAESFIEFATYIAFFPTILSGPIDRPNKFLPQLRKNHQFDYNLAVDGCQQILWGIFTKMVIADTIALITTEAWTNFSSKDASYLLYAVLLSPVQVYADFDGYSNMAIGVGKILGFNVTKNFNHPLLARNVSEYWRRWHMSLTSWITDYVFMPLNIAFRNLATLGLFLAICINLVVIGLWHGANWTYALFGFYHSLLFIPLICFGKFGKNKKLKQGRWGLPLMKDLAMMILTYVLVAFGQVVFFATDVPSISSFISTVASGSWNMSFLFDISTLLPIPMAIFLFCLDWTSRKKEFAIQRASRIYTNKTINILILDLFIALIVAFFGYNGQGSFIYFNF